MGRGLTVTGKHVSRKDIFIPLAKSAQKTVFISKNDIEDVDKVISIMPRVDSQNPDHIEEIQGSYRSLLKSVPATHDFILNAICKAKYWERRNKGKRTFREYRRHFLLEIHQKFIERYFKNCKDHNVRRNLWREIFHGLNTSNFVVISRPNNILSYIRPFTIENMNYNKETGELVSISVYVPKEIYGDIITGKCLKNGGEGFIRIPTNLYPKSTNASKELYPTKCKLNEKKDCEQEKCQQKQKSEQCVKARLGSYNPIYRSQVYSILRNTNVVSKITTSSKDFFRNIAPEYLNSNGYLVKRDINAGKLCQILSQAGGVLLSETLLSYLPTMFEVSDERDITISFEGIKPETVPILLEKLQEKLKRKTAKVGDTF